MRAPPGMLPVSSSPLLTCSSSTTMTRVTNLSTEDRSDTLGSYKHPSFCPEMIHSKLIVLVFLSPLPPEYVDGNTVTLGGNRPGLCSLYANSENSSSAETVFVAEKPGKKRQVRK